jgi:hypothetical protein
MIQMYVLLSCCSVCQTTCLTGLQLGTGKIDKYNDGPWMCALRRICESQYVAGISPHGCV